MAITSASKLFHVPPKSASIPILNSLLAHGAVASLVEALIYSAILAAHAQLQQQMPGIVLEQQLYPLFCKSKFAKQELTYRGCTIRA